MATEHTIQMKLMTIGDSGVGKSWILLRWSNEHIKLNKNQSMPTIGIDFKMKNMEIDGKKMKLQIWDTAGQERFRTITTSYYRNSQGVILVYDITNRTTFENIRTWMAQIQLHADASINKILLGNKCDLVQQRAVTFQEGEALAREFNIPFMETSAINNINIDEAISKIARDVKARLDSASQTSGSNNKPKDKKPTTNAISSDDFKDKPVKKRWC